MIVRAEYDAIGLDADDHLPRELRQLRGEELVHRALNLDAELLQGRIGGRDVRVENDHQRALSERDAREEMIRLIAASPT